MRRLIGFALTLLLSSCSSQSTTQDPAKQRPTDNVQVRPTGWTGVGYAAWKMMTGTQVPKGGRDFSQAEVYGACRMQTESAYKPCSNTYIIFREDGSPIQTHVWVDEAGRFSFPIKPDQTFTLEAVSDDYGVKSSAFTIHRPAEVALTIFTPAPKRETSSVPTTDAK